MTSGTSARHDARDARDARDVGEAREARDGFGRLLRAEWTKFRTVRGWVIGMLVAILATVAIGLLGPIGTNITCGGPGGRCDHTPPTGPDGTAVTDHMYLVHRPLTGDGAITVRVTSLTGRYPPNGTIQAGQGEAGMKPGVQPWTKAGIIIKESTAQGSAYAAVMVTGAHGVRMQYNYTHDKAGRAGAVSAGSPRWLRLARSGDTLTGYDSADGVRWNKIGTARLAGLSSTVRAGLFATSPPYTVLTQSFGGSTSVGGPTQGTAVFDRLGLQGGSAGGGGWTGTEIGGADGGPAAGDLPKAGFQAAGDRFTVRGSGDIAPVVPGRGDIESTVGGSLVGVFAGLIAVIVVATMFITAEYRRGLIRTTLAASPRRGAALAAKAVVIGAVAFATGLAAALITIPLVAGVERSKGMFVYPVSPPTELRVVAGTAAMLTVTAIFALAVGTVLRRGAGAVTAVIAAIVLPYILMVASVLPASAAQWLARITPAAAFAIQQSMPEYSQVTASYTPADGYFPLAPWAGFAVLCGYTALALALAVVVLRRRDA